VGALRRVQLRPLSRRTAIAILVTFAIVQDSLALYCGVVWLVPVMFTSLAFLCFAFTQARTQVISDMLAESDKQREAIISAHEEIQAQHVEMMEQAKVREAMELELRHSHKLEAIGRLAAGIAHEINTPVQFVGDGVQFITDGTRDLLSLIAAYRMAGNAALDGKKSIADLHESALRVEEEFDLDYLAENLPKAATRTLDGLNRIATIVQSMKEFAHPDQKKQTRLDVNRAIASTVTIASHEYRMFADVELHLGECPHVMCHASEVNQVFLNVLINAAHAIRDVVRGTDKKGKIRITTSLEGTSAVIKISDNGVGIPEDIRERVFEPFFTTKEVGKGTGQGLAIAHKVVKGHGGTIACASTVGRGTTFTIKLPIGLKTPLAIPSPFGAAA
jgi:two-component system, NtrC family, sensor kinase